MKVLYAFLTLLVVTFILAGCGDDGRNPITNTFGNPNPGDFLDYEGADIFYIGGLVYSNAEDVQWVQELEYTLGEKFAEITRQTDRANHFKNGTANKLPVGTTIYETDTPAYIAIVDGKEIPYLKMIEG
ncbi:hypothetical protein SAMN04488072_104128 [Lentibacillus halodurans]|uniref:Uncharacterized protein n=1 Tax=Lentibacillus halodurans TaxID=237679 RepID=A0A1I0X3A3_9BACI|nr:hypothetical protein [Lentibacillus halodurans]SFA95519.1 hypothetical protein SAMN04488072_104128 [Lentibacillus halodurans]